MMWLWLMGCTQVGDGQGREMYNQALVMATNQNFEAAQTQWLSARDQAGTDQELRQNSAYNLALSYGLQAKTLEESDPQKASEMYEQAISWFHDAIRLNEKAQDARENLEVALLRKQALADRLTQGANSLEKRSERLLSDIVTVQESLLQLVWEMDQHGDRNTPQGYQSQFAQMAVEIRSLQADANTIFQLAEDERRQLENVLESERSSQQQQRQMQLQGFEVHFAHAQNEIGESRRDLRGMRIDESIVNLHDSKEGVLRALEQFLDPVSRIAGIVQSQQQSHQRSNLWLQAQKSALSLPSWLTSDWLSLQQEAIFNRLNELNLGIEQFIGSQVDSNDENAAQIQEMQQQFQQAQPFLREAGQQMQQLSMAFEGQNLQEIPDIESKIESNLMRAWEYFADVKTLVEWAYQSNETMQSLLENVHPETLMTTQQDFSLEQSLNIDRLLRLESVLSKEKALAIQQSQQSSGNPQEQSLDSGESIQQIEALYDRAQELRQSALEHLQNLDLTSDISQTQAILDTVDQDLHQLRMLFFSIIEHLQDSAQTQNRLLSDLTKVSGLEYEDLLSELGLQQIEESQLQKRVEMISQELQKMADDFAEQGKSTESEQFGQAFVETGVASQLMQEVLTQMQQMSQDQQTSYDPEKMLNNENLAYEALLRAIQALQPPQSGDQNNEPDQNQEDNSDPQNAPPEDSSQQMSQKQAQRKMQEAQEKEAERKAKEMVVSQGSVEKDW